MSKRISYVLIGDDRAVERTKSRKQCLMTGLWAHHAAVQKYGDNGHVRMLRRVEDLEEYSVVHVNLTGGNFGLLGVIGEELKNSSTKLMANIDFTIADWDGFPYFTLIKKIFEHVDIPFHVEPVGAEALSLLLGKKVYTLPHPCDIECLDQHKKGGEPYIATIFHRYNPTMVNILWLAQKDVPMNHVLLGYTKTKIPTLPLFDHTHKYSQFMEMIDLLSNASFALDLFPFPVYGRAVVDAAALAIPTVCSNQIEACRRCFPALCIEPWDVKRANALFNELIKDDEKREAIYKNAYHQAEYYGYKACYERLVNILEEVEGKEGGGGATPKASSGNGLAEDALGKYWQRETTVDEHKQFWNRSNYKEAQEQQVIEILKNYCPNINSILDAGAGTCRVGKALKGTSYKYVAVDFSETMLAKCDPEFETKVAKLTALPFNDDSFDMVMCLHVIRHNNPEDYEQIINELCRGASKYVLILNPFANKKEEVKQIFKREIWDMPMLLSDLDEMMSNAGFRRCITIPGKGDYKGTDLFVLYTRNGRFIEQESAQTASDKKGIDMGEAKKLWKQVQDRYERRSNKGRVGSYEQYIQGIAKQFKGFVGIRNGLVLDLGCGNGNFCGDSYEAAGQEYIDTQNIIIGLDPLESMEKRFPVIRAFGENIPFQDACFDTLVIASALDHIIDPIVVLKESKRILKEGGKIFIWNSIHPEGKINPWHLHTWTSETLLEMIGEVFTVEKYITAGNDKKGYNLFVKGGF